MTQQRIHKSIVREYIAYYRNEQHLEIPYMQALRELASATLRRLEYHPNYPEYRSALAYFIDSSWFTPRCRFGCLSEERAKYLGLCPWTDQDSALYRCFRCDRHVCMDCDAPVLDSEMLCWPECPAGAPVACPHAP